MWFFLRKETNCNKTQFPTPIHAPRHCPWLLVEILLMELSLMYFFFLKKTPIINFYVREILISLWRNKILAFLLIFLQNLEQSVWCSGSSYFSFLSQGVTFSAETWHHFWNGICDHRWYSIPIKGNGHFCLQHLPFGTKNLFSLLSNPAQMQEYTGRIQQDSGIRPVLMVLYILLILN